MVYYGIHGILSDVHLPCFPEDPAAITLRFSKQLMADSKDGKASGLPVSHLRDTKEKASGLEPFLSIYRCKPMNYDDFSHKSWEDFPVTHLLTIFWLFQTFFIFQYMG